MYYATAEACLGLHLLHPLSCVMSQRRIQNAGPRQKIFTELAELPITLPVWIDAQRNVSTTAAVWQSIGNRALERRAGF